MGDTAIELALAKNHTETVKALLQAGALADLALAAENGNSAIVTEILKDTEHVNVCDNKGETGLHKACSKNHQEVKTCLSRVVLIT